MSENKIISVSIQPPHMVQLLVPYLKGIKVSILEQLNPDFENFDPLMQEFLWEEARTSTLAEVEKVIQLLESVDEESGLAELTFADLEPIVKGITAIRLHIQATDLADIPEELLEGRLDPSEYAFQTNPQTQTAYVTYLFLSFVQGQLIELM